ncbi:acyl-ACP desaturase [Micromonospora soli]|uniref:acyl-ACP desaturase n=1 Tax=Micromonospora sp. NBRC 110009 TaxID=3061627 RepID=UPI0026741734|nr:acyl-ACP desaturase [Micromonospora sp. NBRC 110009]WKT97536.1 acyl-ACP desaturase [Micromonospora sp. NBRC 110009]
MTGRALREAFHREYMTFFEQAERTRRWNVFTDIDWDRLAGHDPDPRLVLCAETFCGVEMYLPDYLRAHLDLMRGDYGRAWFAANWGYEEAKHSLVLREYLRRSGARSEAQLHDYADAVLARRWEPPYDDGRRMTIYGALQELTTFVIYRKQRGWAAGHGDPVLPEVYRLVGRDEMAHSRFYLRMIRLHLAEDRAGTLADLAYVLRTFRMPAEDLLPDYDTRVEVMRAAGIDRSVFLTEVVLPLLRDLGLTRHDLPRVPAQAATEIPGPPGLLTAAGSAG